MGSVQSGSRTCQRGVKRLGGLRAAPRPWSAYWSPCMARHLLSWLDYAMSQLDDISNRQIHHALWGKISRQHSRTRDALYTAQGLPMSSRTSHGAVPHDDPYLTTSPMFPSSAPT